VELWQSFSNVNAPDSRINVLWKATQTLLDRIVSQMDLTKQENKHEGSLLCTLKFAEKAVLAWTVCPADYQKTPNDISLDLLRPHHPFLKAMELRQIAKSIFAQFINTLAKQR
jgi:hypothetical protein